MAKTRDETTEFGQEPPKFFMTDEGTLRVEPSGFRYQLTAQEALVIQQIQTTKEISLMLGNLQNIGDQLENIYTQMLASSED